MSNNSLASTYSRAVGMALNKPYINLLPYPLPFEKYLVIHPSSGNASKNYDYFQLVVDFIKPELDKRNINIIQLGGKDDRPIQGCLNLQGSTSLAQSAFIIKNSLLLIGNDSMLAHMAGILDVDVIALYGCTSATAHGPHWRTNHTILIESHRNGNNPTYSFNENPKTVNFIKVEEVIDGIYSILDIMPENNLKTINVGPKFNEGIIEVVLDSIVSPEFMKGAPLHLRYDYLENPQNLANQLSVRPCVIVTDKVIPLNLLQALKKHVIHICYEVKKEHNSQFTLDVKKLGIPVSLFTRLTEEEIQDMKLDYFEVGVINIIKTFQKSDIKDSNLITENTLFKTNKIILSNNKVYPSNLHRVLDIVNAEENKVIDIPKFYEELEHFFIYNKR